MRARAISARCCKDAADAIRKVEEGLGGLQRLKPQGKIEDRSRRGGRRMSQHDRPALADRALQVGVTGNRSKGEDLASEKLPCDVADLAVGFGTVGRRARVV